MTEPRTRHGTASLSSAEHVEPTCDRFKEAWIAGERPSIEDFLQAASEQDRLKLLRDLVHIELQSRQSRGETFSASDYLNRFPALDPSWLSALISAPVEIERDDANSPPHANVTRADATRPDEAIHKTAENSPTRSSAAPIRVPSGKPRFPTLVDFEILAELGRGGMGIVYRAFDVKRQKQVALKTMQGVEPTALYRFKQEFRTLADLSHPNLISLYELMSDGQDWYFSMELIDGVSFLEYVRAKAPPIRPATNGDRLRDALAQLAEGIHALHQAGKLHRDIKPGNVLVTREGRVVIMDFGLVAELDRSGEHRSTEPHLLGTVAYMAPEQAASLPVTPACDWYAVGVMLYQALTGQLPFRGTPFEVLMNKQQHDPKAPRELVPAAPEDLNQLTVELLRRDPATRPTGRDIVLRLARGERPAPSAEGPSTERPALVGRKRPLQELADAFRTARGGNTVVLHVQGRSGVGKSALVHAFLEGLAENHETIVLTGRCYEREAVPYKALDVLIDSLSRYLVRLPSGEAEALLPRDVQALARVFPVLRRVPAVAQAPRRPLDLSDPQEVRRRALAALRDLLGRLGDRWPLALFIDDLQWGDLDSAALLIDLVRPPDAPAMLLVLGYRSEDAASSPCVRAVSEKAAHRILTVEPLTFAEGRELVLSLLEGDPSAQAHADAIVREAGGSPFFLYELAQHVRQAPKLALPPEPRTERFTLPTTSSEAASDITLNDVLWKRVLRLPESARRLLEVVAVAGRPLRQIDALRAAAWSYLTSSASSESFVLQPFEKAVAELRAGRLIRSAGATDRDEIETYHDRIRETVVMHLSPAVLKEYHGRLANVLKESGQADWEQLAIHYQGADNLVEASLYFEMGAARASETLAFDRAAKLYRLALESAAHGAVEMRGLRTRLADALANAGRGAESAREYLTASHGASLAQELELRRRAALQFLIAGHIDEGLAALRDVLAAVGMSMPATPRRAFWSLILRRVQLGLRGLGFRPRRASEVAPADLTRINICWSATAGLSMVDTIQGAYFQTRGLLLALAAGEPYHLARALASEAGHSAIGGGRTRQRTAQLLQAAQTLADQVDQPYPRALVTMMRGVAAAFEGHWPQALSHCDQAEQVFRGSCTGVVWELDTLHRFGLWALMFMGDVPEMGRRLPVLLKEAQERDDLYAVVNFSAVVGTFLRLADDQPEAARDNLQKVMTQWSRQGFHVQHLDSIYDEVQIDLYQGKGTAAWERLERHWPTASGSHFFRIQQIRIMMHHLRGRCAVAAARETTDPRFLRIAASQAKLLEKERMPWADALACLLRGSAPATRDAETTLFLRQALAGFETLDMKLYAAAARWRLGEATQGAEGEALIALAIAALEERKIKKPASMMDLLAPVRRHV